MARLTKRNEKGVAYMAIADTLPKRQQEIEGSKPILEALFAMFQKLAYYEDKEEREAVIGEETENELRNLELRLINGEGDKEPVGLFGTISFDKGRPHGVSIGKLESVETIEGLHGGLIKHLKFRQNGNDCTKCKHSFIDVHYGPSCKRFDAYLKCDYEKREVE